MENDLILELILERNFYSKIKNLESCMRESPHPFSTPPGLRMENEFEIESVF